MCHKVEKIETSNRDIKMLNEYYKNIINTLKRRITQLEEFITDLMEVLLTNMSGEDFKKQLGGIKWKVRT